MSNWTTNNPCVKSFPTNSGSATRAMAVTPNISLQKGIVAVINLAAEELVAQLAPQFNLLPLPPHRRCRLTI